MSERPLAAIDIGTNSFHMVVARVGEVESGDGPAGPAFEVIAREKEMVRLGSGSGDMKLLAPEAIDRGVAALERLARIAAVHDADIHAVATSAVREAENAQEFLDRARAEAGVEVEVISGVEEARLIHLGVLQAVPVFDQRLRAHRHRRRQHRDPGRAEGRDPRRRQPEAGRHQALPTLLPR